MKTFIRLKIIIKCGIVVLNANARISLASESIIEISIC